MSKNDESADRKLHMIAEALRIPVEHFFVENQSSNSVVTALECICLWSMIKSDDGRKRALEFIRSIVHDEQL